ncbi:MAG TPA: dihydrofolate reductase family protein [Kofleriaceae bacterium]
MRNLISLAHISLDGFMAGPDGDMSFLSMTPEMGDLIYPLINTVDLSVYGRVTYQLMESYWPTLGDGPEVGAPERKHARWYNGVQKLVASRTLATASATTRIVRDDIVGALRAAKQEKGGDIMVFGSPTLMHTLIAADVIDTYQLTIQPVLVGRGTPLFANVEKQQRLQLRDTKTFSNGVIAARYARR